MSKIRYRRFPMPGDCDAKQVVMRSLIANDEVEAALMADQRMTKTQSSSRYVVIEMQRKEAVRLALVAIDGRRVNDDGAPCVEIDEWSLKSWAALEAFYHKMNGIPGDELGNCMEAGVEVTLETLSGPSPKVDSTGK